MALPGTQSLRTFDDVYEGQCKLVLCLQIYTNGYVTFGLNFESRYPDRLNKYLLSYPKRQAAKKQGFAMLAPMWTDNDARAGDVYYHIYDLTKPGSTATDKARVKVSEFGLFYATNCWLFIT